MPAATRKRTSKREVCRKVLSIAAGKTDVKPAKNMLLLIRYPSPSGMVGRPSRRQHILGLV